MPAHRLGIHLLRRIAGGATSLAGYIIGATVLFVPYPRPIFGAFKSRRWHCAAIVRGLHDPIHSLPALLRQIPRLVTTPIWSANMAKMARGIFGVTIRRDIE
jgi:hypothetical protein